jgi:hypothetical protein
MVLETLVFLPLNQLTWLVAREYFVVSQFLCRAGLTMFETVEELKRRLETHQLMQTALGAAKINMCFKVVV